MKKVVFVVFLLMNFSSFSGEKLQMLKPEFEKFVNTGYDIFEKLAKDTLENKEGIEYNDDIFVKTKDYSEDYLEVRMEINPKISELSQDDEDFPEGSITFSLDEVSDNYFNFVLVFSDEESPQIIEGDYDYMKTLIPFFEEEFKKQSKIGF